MDPTDRFSMGGRTDSRNGGVSKSVAFANSPPDVHTVVPISHVTNKDHKMPKPVNEKDSAVLVRNLCKGYDKHGPRVLNDFSMNVRKGTM